MNTPDTLSAATSGAERSSSPQRLPRPFYWSVRRELWENRSITWAPLAVTATVFLATLIRLFTYPGRLAALPAGDSAERHLLLVRPFNVAPAPILLAALLVGFFYALDALYGERRDRSLLFWKSMPVSDRTTVLAKASIPLVVLPVIALALSWLAFFGLLAAATLIFWAQGASAAPLWSAVSVGQQPLVMAYGLAAHVLWFAPIYAAVLLISAWARRLPLLWVVLPPAALAVTERLTFGSSYVLELLCYRVRGAMKEAFVGPADAHSGAIERLDQLDVAGFLTSPGLWLGLVAAAVFLEIAVRRRRRCETL